MQKRIGAAVLAAAAVAMTLTGTAQAETNPKCARVTQIGSTAYIKKGAETVASVKQFKGCDRNWAYIYVWDSWKAKHPTGFQLRAAIWTRTGAEAIDLAGGGWGQQEVWSSGADTLSSCTRAVGDVLIRTSADMHGSTEERC